MLGVLLGSGFGIEQEGKERQAGDGICVEKMESEGAEWGWREDGDDSGRGCG